MALWWGGTAEQDSTSIFLIIGTIGPLPLGGCVIEMMLYFYLALIGVVMIGMEGMGVQLICRELIYGRREVD